MNVLKAAACAAFLNICATGAHAQATPIGAFYCAYSFDEDVERFTPPVTSSFHENLLQGGAQPGGTVFKMQPLGHSQVGFGAGHAGFR